MLIPYSTDAPVYHFPVATIALVVVNVLMFVVTIGALDQFEFLMLEFDTINPLQWLTTNFMHLDFFHLLGNMFFLWGFGLVVEGKLGAVKFTALYLGMAVLYGALVQIVVFFIFPNEGSALGASGVISSILAIAVLWAPKNDMNCLLLMGVFTRPLTVSILNFGLFFIAMQFLFFALGGFHMSSEALHIAGLAVGLPFGTYLVKKEIVDCEGWDYFTLFHATTEQQKFRQTKRRRDRAESKLREEVKGAKGKLDRLDTSLKDAIQSGNDKVTLALYSKFVNEFDAGSRLPGKAAMSLAGALQREGEWESSIPVLVQLLKKHSAEKTVGLRLNLAQILIQRSDKPKQAIAVLAKIPKDKVNPKQVGVFNKLVKTARKQIAEGSVEFDIHDW